MKIQKSPNPPRVENVETTAPAASPMAEDTAERMQSGATKPSHGIDAGAARLLLAKAVKAAEPLVIDASHEASLADLVRSAALASDADFNHALSTLPVPDRKGAAPASADLLSLLDLRSEAISSELADATTFHFRVAQIRARILG